MSLDLPETQSHIGNRLREAREAKGMDIDQVSRQLKIQSKFITAIEALDTEALPSIGYVLGYVRAYAGLVGLDGQSAVQAYKADSEVPENLGMRDQPHFVPTTKLRLPRGFFAATTVLACSAVLAFWYSSNSTAKATAFTGFEHTANAKQDIVTTPQVHPDLMVIKATAPSWVEIKDKDGKVIISRILVAGESWEAHQDAGVSITARDAGALELYIGEDLMGRLGAKGMPMNDVPMPSVQPDFMSDHARELAGLPPKTPVETAASEITETVSDTEPETKNGL